MSDYESNTSLSEIALALGRARRVVLTTHAKPDGDALGSVIALAQALEKQGVTAERWIMPPLPENLKILNGTHAPLHFRATEADPPPAGEPDLIVVLDTGSWSQLGPMRGWLEPRCGRVVVIDHHLHGDVPAGMRFVDTQAAATCQIVADLIDLMGCPFDRTIADALYVGVASDTGWFRFSNVTPRVHLLAARLLELDVGHAALHLKLERSERLQKLLLMTRALGSMELLAGGTAVLMTLRTSDFKATGAHQEETERIIDLPQAVEEVQLVALLTEVDESNVRISFRSKPGEVAIDVNLLARRFGGGGHARAAGAKVNQPLAMVLPQLTSALINAASRA